MHRLVYRGSILCGARVIVLDIVCTTTIADDISTN